MESKRRHKVQGLINPQKQKLSILSKAWKQISEIRYLVDVWYESIWHMFKKVEQDSMPKKFFSVYHLNKFISTRYIIIKRKRNDPLQPLSTKDENFNTKNSR